ncbi:MAG: hypothetical protein ABIJ16_08280, partial [Bacteroidota bacterium]
YTADPSAMLDVKTTDKGMLVPRLTTNQRTAISNPATGLLVFDSTSNSFWFNSGSPSVPAWVELVAGVHINKISDADNDTKIQVEKNPNENIVRFDIAGIGNSAVYWQSFEAGNQAYAYYISLIYSSGILYDTGGSLKTDAYSVRCIKD